MDPLSVDGATVSERLLFASDFTTAFGADLRLRRLADRGSLYRVRRGVYIDEALWRVLGPRDKYAAVVRGAARVPRQENVLSHRSAAVIWNLPMLTSWPGEAHFLTERHSGGRSESGIRKHALGIDAADIAVRDGLQVTTIERTVVDLATVSPRSEVCRCGSRPGALHRALRAYAHVDHEGEAARDLGTDASLPRFRAGDRPSTGAAVVVRCLRCDRVSPVAQRMVLHQIDAARGRAIPGSCGPRELRRSAEDMPSA